MRSTAFLVAGLTVSLGAARAADKPLTGRPVPELGRLDFGRDLTSTQVARLRAELRGKSMTEARQLLGRHWSKSASLALVGGNGIDYIYNYKFGLDCLHLGVRGDTVDDVWYVRGVFKPRHDE